MNGFSWLKRSECLLVFAGLYCWFSIAWAGGTDRPDPKEVRFGELPIFQFEDEIYHTDLKPHPPELLPYSYQEVHQAGQQLWLAVPVSDQPFALTQASSTQPAPVALRVLGPVKGFQITNPGQPFPGDFNALVKQIREGHKTEAARALAVFEYIDQNIRQWWFPAEGYRTIRLHSDEVAQQIWGYGYGFCSDVARIGVALWESMGLKARILGIDPYHTVAEVFYDDDWHLFDVQHKTYWENKKGGIASAEALRKDPDLFWQKLDRYGLDPIGYPPIALANWYQKASISYHTQLHWEQDTYFGIDLRPGEFFEMDYVGKPRIHHPDFWVQAYGSKTLDRDPPWPFAGKQYYVPHWYGEEPIWQTIELEDGRTAYVIPMQSPYLFTEGFLRLPELADKAEVFVYAHETYHYVGPVKAAGARLGRHMAGTRQFAVCIVPDEALEHPAQTLATLEIRADLQLSHLALPQFQKGGDLVHAKWQQGQPTVFFWHMPKGPDLQVTLLYDKNQQSQVGKATSFQFQITNLGDLASVPTPALLYNTTTHLVSERVEQVGRYMVPPLEPGASYVLNAPWQANTRLTWYGQNPYVQHFTFYLDPDKQRADQNRTNQELAFTVLLRKENGELPELPGHTAFPAKKKNIFLPNGFRLH